MIRTVRPVLPTDAYIAAATLGRFSRLAPQEVPSRHRRGRAGKVRPADRAEHRRANRRSWAAMQAEGRRVAVAARRAGLEVTP